MCWILKKYSQRLQSPRIGSAVSDRNVCWFAGLKVRDYTGTVGTVPISSLPRVFSCPLLNIQKKFRCGNDPSAGSPTETLLRLHLPLNDEV